MRVLMTGFGPFGDVSNNPSGRIVEQFAMQGLPGHELVTRVLPVSFERSQQEIEDLLRSTAFDVALLLGLAAKEGMIRLEQYGRNLDRARIPDCDGSQPQESPICREGPDVYLTDIPLEPLVAALEAGGIPARISDDAGGYVCNHTYYTALRILDHGSSDTRCLFLHVPPDETTFEDAEPHPTMPFHQQIEAVRLVLSKLTKSVT
jgi:pyroglutamyl-peptidase